MKASRKDQNAIAALLYENDLSFDDGMGLEDPSLGAPEQDVVMEIDPVGPVSPEFGGEDEDDLYDSVKGDLKKLAEFSSRLQQVAKPNGGLQPWMIAKIAKASEYVSDVYFQLDDQVDFANTGFEQADGQSL
jgi:hypothetical protein